MKTNRLRIVVISIGILASGVGIGAGAGTVFAQSGSSAECADLTKPEFKEIKELATAEAEAPIVMRQGKELYRAVYATLKKWALAKEEADCQQAAVELLYVYEELFGDTQLPEDTQSTLRTLVRSRLKSLAQTLSVYNKKRANEIRKEALVQGKKSNQPKNLAVPKGKGEAAGSVLAQRNGGNIENDNWFGTGNSNSNADCGEDLVELIQNTIRRPTWQANGGEASIYYYRQLRALVVNQTQEGHEEIERLLEALRRAGS